jgi:DNA primase
MRGLLTSAGGELIADFRMKPTEEIRSAADIVKIVGDYVKLRKAGANLVGLCPFHQEKTASFAVHPVRQIFHCFGCGAGGDVFKFVMLIENVSFPEAVERVAEKAGVKLPSSWGGERDDARSKERTALYAMHELAAQFFATQLGATMEGRAAHAYLLDRGLGDETLAQFRLGYAPSAGQALSRRLSEAGFSPELCEASGLVIAGRESGRSLDRFRRRVIFPVANESGKVVAFAGRALGEDQPKYLNSPETPIYTKSRILYHLHRAGGAIRKLDAAILVEGYMDCIALASSGIENVIASCGTSLTESQVRVLARYTRRVVVNYDPDSAGIAAAERSLGLLLEEGFEINVLTLPAGLDPDSFIRRHGADAYRERLAAAPAYLDYLTDRAAAQHDLNTPEGKVRAVNAVLPYLIRVGNPLLRDEMGSRLAERLRVDERLLRGEVKRAVRGGDSKIQLRPEAVALETTVAEKELLQAFLQNPELAAEFLEAVVESGDCQGLPAEAIFKAFLSDYKQWGSIDPLRFEDSLRPEERRRLFAIQFSRDQPADRTRVLSCRRGLKRWQMERQRSELQAAIERAVREKDREAWRQLWEAKRQLHGL